MDRRNFVRGVGLVTITGGLAGCSQGGDSGGDGGNTEGDGTATDSMSMVSAPDEVASYLEGDETFDGQMADLTGESSATVSVGAEGNGGPNAFDPSAINISTGTTVTFAWTGNGSHNVVEEEGAFDSGSIKSSGTFQHTFEEAGTYLYYCTPHKSQGMKGAIVVE